jgi:hypothetical protein
VAAATFLSRWRWYILDGADLQRDKVRRESNMTRNLLAIASIVLTAAFALPARAQDVLPRPEQPFKGHIGRTVKQSTKDFPQEVKAPKDAPNILLILTDDVGFGASSTFGGPVPTPTMDRLANEGLRYTQFHTTALCSPTRAALLTGRNHHSAATGMTAQSGLTLFAVCRISASDMMFWGYPMISNTEAIHIITGKGFRGREA